MAGSKSSLDRTDTDELDEDGFDETGARRDGVHHEAGFDEAGVNEPLDDEALTDEPLSGEHLADEPLSGERVAGEPFAEETSAYDHSAFDSPVEESEVHEPAVHESAVEEPVVEEPVVEEPGAFGGEQPAGYSSTYDDEFDDDTGREGLGDVRAENEAEDEHEGVALTDEEDPALAYKLGSPIPGQPTGGPVLVEPGAMAEPDPEPLETRSDLDLEPGLGSDVDSDLDSGLGSDLDNGLDDGLNSELEPVGVSSVQHGFAADAASGRLLSSEASEDLLGRWTAIQVSFVDDPGQSVHAADALMQDIGTALQNAFRERTEQLSSAWQGTAADTETLRLSLQEYRTFLGVVLPK